MNPESHITKIYKLINNLDFLIYSSHKTSTQTLVNTFKTNNYNAAHCHTTMDENNENNENYFISKLNEYKLINNKKLKIISVIRNPCHRLISSFFQSKHDDEIMFLQISPDKTTVNTNDIDKLCDIYCGMIENNNANRESIDELSTILNINIIENLEKKEHYYYYNHDLFELFVLDFNRTVDYHYLEYLNTIFTIHLNKPIKVNLTKNKIYYSKYIEVKKRTQEITHINEIIKSKNNSFYFDAFISDDTIN
jgi:hypothetical protein